MERMGGTKVNGLIGPQYLHSPAFDESSCDQPLAPPLGSEQMSGLHVYHGRLAP